MKRFVEWYNKEHHHRRIQYVITEERHTGKDKEVLEQRKKVCEEAKKKHPQRWAKEIGNWSFSKEECINELMQLMFIENLLRMHVLD